MKQNKELSNPEDIQVEMVVVVVKVFGLFPCIAWDVLNI